MRRRKVKIVMTCHPSHPYDEAAIRQHVVDAVGLWVYRVEEVEMADPGAFDTPPGMPRVMSPGDCPSPFEDVDCRVCGGDGWTDGSAELRRDGRQGDTTCLACGGTGKQTVKATGTYVPSEGAEAPPWASDLAALMDSIFKLGCAQVLNERGDPAVPEDAMQAAKRSAESTLQHFERQLEKHWRA